MARIASNRRLKLMCHSSLLPTCVTLWRRNHAVPATRSACAAQLSREPLGGIPNDFVQRRTLSDGES
jgi:hypothetical protein